MKKPNKKTIIVVAKIMASFVLTFTIFFILELVFEFLRMKSELDQILIR